MSKHLNDKIEIISAINLLKAEEYYFQNKTLGKELSEYKAFKCLDFSRSKTLKLQLNI